MGQGMLGGQGQAALEVEPAGAVLEGQVVPSLAGAACIGAPSSWLPTSWAWLRV